MFTFAACGGGGTTSLASNVSGSGGTHPTPPPPPPPPTPPPTTPPPPTPPPPTPPPPAGSTVLDKVEKSNWLTCGNCGNDNATGVTAPYSFTLGVASPSEDGSSTQFSIAAVVPYTNAYFYQQHTPVTNQIGAMSYEFDDYIPTGSESAPPAFEFECQQLLDG